MLYSELLAPLSLILAFGATACANSQSKADPLAYQTPPPSQMGGLAFEGEPKSQLNQTFTDEQNEKITLYPGQVEMWSGNSIRQKAVVSVEKTGTPQPVYGLVWITAKTQVYPNTKRVSFNQVRFTMAQFPSEPALSNTVLKTLRDHQSDVLKPVALESLRSNFAIEKAENETKHIPLRNGPPKIVARRSPTLLVLVDGAPVLRDAGVAYLMRVINTRALILYDSERGRYYFYMGDRWMDALSLQGPWIETDQPSPRLEEAKQIAVSQKQVDLLNEPDSPLMKNLAQHNTPEVYVSTEPTEILETVGTPELKSISGTRLLYVTNTEQNIFLDQTDQNYYVLLSGRWYRSRSLEGPWKYVAADRIPKEFSKIPETHPKGSVLASIPGTQQAGEAKISNELPQTARVDRQQATLVVQYDGEPQFKPIEQTSLQYAENSKTAVIKINSNSYYALQSGVWFQAESPNGPWAVATHVPAEIYTIPPNSPVYYVTYVRIYDSTPTNVYVGYTPGYLGTYCCSDGVVVYGTGYYYPPWIGSYWIGPPITFGVGFTWGYGGAFYAGPAFYPWWGPWWSVPVYVGYPYGVIGAAPVGQGTVYQGWSSGVVQTQNPAPFQSAYLGSGGSWQMGGHAATIPPEAFNPPATTAAAPPPVAAPAPMPAPAPAMPAAPPIPPSAPAVSGALSHGFSGGGGGWSAHK